jgi:hypothetical protein
LGNFLLVAGASIKVAPNTHSKKQMAIFHAGGILTPGLLSLGHPLSFFEGYVFSVI